MIMLSTLKWHEIALRLALSAIAGALVIAGTSEGRRAAERRTNIFLCVAASTVMMIQVKLLPRTTGAMSTAPGILNFADMPVYLLTGVGLVSGAMILRCDDAAQGLTRAATLWFIAVMGLCFGGGQLGLGTVAFVLIELVLWDRGHLWLQRSRRDVRRRF
jgi:putative Mg2+ transporter-C (MgtC) family protein